MLECKEIDGLMMDWLYQELAPSEADRVTAHVGGCARCTAEVDALRRTRAVFRDLAHDEPPASVSAILLHEAARRAPAAGSARAEGSFFSRLLGWFQPVFAHPAAAAVATLVLVAGVAGTLYVRRGSELAESERPARSASTPPSAASIELDPEVVPPSGAAEPAAADPAPGAATTPEQPKDGYVADVLDAEGQAELRKQADSKSLARRDRSDKNAGFAHAGDDDLDAWDAPKKKKAPAPTKPQTPAKTSRKPAPEPMLEQSAKREMMRGGEAANAVSGADLADGRSSVGGLGSAPAAPTTAPTASASTSTRTPNDADASTEAYRPYRDQKKLTAAEVKWLSGQESKLSSAVKAKRCRDAASIANDILDRNADYYTKRVAGSKTVQPCSWYVSDETRRRRVSRSKGAGAGPQGAHAAPQQKAKARAEDEAAAETAE